MARAVRRLAPYEPTTSLGRIADHPEQSPLKLDWNEATIPPSPRVLEALTDALAGGVSLNWYPELTSPRLRALLADYTGVAADRLLVTNGSDDALALACHTYLDPGDEVVVPVPTYTHFLVFAQSVGGRIEEVRFKDAFELDVARILAAIQPRTKLVYLVSPNNPTGVTYSKKVVTRVLEHAPHAMVIVDEAYFEFFGHSVIELVDRYPNLLVTRTFSKSFGLAGLRIGYLAAHPRTIPDLRRLFNPKSVNALGQVAAAAALEDIAYVKDYVAEVDLGKEMFVEFCKERGLPARSTPANFVLVQPPDPVGYCRDLAEDGVYVRDRSTVPEVTGWVRVGAGTQDQMREVIRRIRARECGCRGGCQSG